MTNTIESSKYLKNSAVVRKCFSHKRKHSFYLVVCFFALASKVLSWTENIFSVWHSLTPQKRMQKCVQIPTLAYVSRWGVTHAWLCLCSYCAVVFQITQQHQKTLPVHLAWNVFSFLTFCHCMNTLAPRNQISFPLIRTVSYEFRHKLRSTRIE